MKIHIKEYPLPVILGYYAQEQTYTQDVIVNLTVQLNTAESLFSNDDLTLTADYDELIEAMRCQVRGQKFKLIETIVWRIGQHLLATFPLIDAIDLEIRKDVIPNAETQKAKISISHSFVRGGKN